MGAEEGATDKGSRTSALKCYVVFLKLILFVF